MSPTSCSDIHLVSPRIRRQAATVLIVLLAVGSAACGSSSSASAATSTTSAPVLSGPITVSAASSLSEVFPALAIRFESLHPGTTVDFDFGSSGTLAAQILSGAPTDVFAAAAPAPMAMVQAAHLVAGSPTTFTRNRLEIVVKPGNPKRIHTLADLSKAGIVSLCVVTAPCGATAAKALSDSHVVLAPGTVTLGQDVDATLAQVTTGDADAGIVYVTNVVAAGTAATGEPIPLRQNVTTSYPIAVLTASSHGAVAEAWVAFVLGPVGSAALRRAHFLPAT